MTALTGAGRLVRLALRRDRIQLPIWIVVLAIVELSSVASIVGLYPTEADRVEFAVGSAKSPAAVAFNGIVAGTSVGAILSSQTLLIMTLGAALMSTLCVVRHTRQNEETGRAELLGAAVVGRHALLTAGLVVASLANFVLGLVNLAVLLAYGLPLGGSVATAAAIVLAGIAFAAIAAVCAQLTEGARAANGLAAAVLGAAFLLRAIGDGSGSVINNGTTLVSGVLSWLSPIGWAQQTRPYYDNRAWPLLLLVVFTALLTRAAYAVSDRRDLGAGVVASRPGPAAAAPSLLSSIGLAWRLQRGVLIGWVVAIAIVGGVYGSIGDEIKDLVGSGDDVSDLLSQIGGGDGSLADLYFSAVLGFMGIAIAAYAVQALLRLRGEESAGRLEAVLATGVSRARWLASHAVVAVLGVVGLLAVTGVSMGLTYGVVIGDLGVAPPIIGAALVQVPAALVMAGVALAAFGVLPRLAIAVSWGVLGAFLLLGQVGQLLGLPDAVLDVSPFTHVPRAPVAAVTVTPLLVLTAVAFVLVVGGFRAFRRRDIAF